jgi:hypothetical protein
VAGGGGDHGRVLGLRFRECAGGEQGFGGGEFFLPGEAGCCFLLQDIRIRQPRVPWRGFAPRGR